MEFPKAASPDISGVRVPTMLPKISATLCITNFGNNFKIRFCFLCFLPKSAFSIFQFGKEWNAPVQKFLFDVILIE